MSILQNRHDHQSYTTLPKTDVHALYGPLIIIYKYILSVKFDWLIDWLIDLYYESSQTNFGVYKCRLISFTNNRKNLILLTLKQNRRLLNFYIFNINISNYLKNNYI